MVSRCCVLVDCTRGFCEEDRSLLRLLSKRNISHQVSTSTSTGSKGIGRAYGRLERSGVGDVAVFLAAPSTIFRCVINTSFGVVCHAVSPISHGA